jgi:hypothetical protein
MCLSWRRGTHRRTWSPPPPALAALLQVSEEGVAAEDGAVLPLSSGGVGGGDMVGRASVRWQGGGDLWPRLA